MRQKEKMIRDIIQTAIAVISAGGALDIRNCVDDIVYGITLLPEYKNFVETQIENFVVKQCLWRVMRFQQ